MREPLYKITNRYLEAYGMLYSCADMPQEAINDTLESIEVEINDKALNIARMIKNLEANALAIKNAEDDMAERRRYIENKIKSLKSYLFFNLSNVEFTSIDAPDISIKKGRVSESVIIDNQKLIDKKYIKTKEEPNKEEIKKDLKNGVEIPGARLETKQNYIIK
jgi:hypothetical protein